MCLSKLSNPGDIIKLCEPSKRFKRALVAYKIVSANLNNPKNIRLESIFFDRKVKPGWNKDNKTKRIIRAYHDKIRRKETEFSYPAGLHLFANFEMALEHNKQFFFAHVVPVHFYSKDVVAEGTEGTLPIGIDLLPVNVVVVSKFFVIKNDHKEIIDIEKREMRILNGRKR